MPTVSAMLAAESENSLYSACTSCVVKSKGRVEQSLVESKGRGNGCPVAQGCRLRPAILSLPVGICIGTFHRENMSLKVGTVPTGTDISGLRAVAQDCMACWIQPKCSLTRGAGAADIGVGRARV